MAEYRLRLQGDRKVLAKLRDPQVIRGPLRRFLGSVGAQIEGEWKSNVSVDTGRYRSSITHKVEPQKVIIGTTVKYAPKREFGAKPHWPPEGALQPWARRHGFPAGSVGDFIVRRIIARRGIKAENALGRAIKSSGAAIQGFARTLARDIGRNWGK